MWRLLVILLIMNKDKQCIRLFFMAEYMSGTQISEGTSKVASVNGIIVSSVEIDHVCVCVFEYRVCLQLGKNKYYYMHILKNIINCKRQSHVFFLKKNESPIDHFCLLRWCEQQQVTNDCSLHSAACKDETLNRQTTEETQCDRREQEEATKQSKPERTHGWAGRRTTPGSPVASAPYLRFCMHACTVVGPAAGHSMQLLRRNGVAAAPMHMHCT
jgi:hypothetical protein